MVSENATKNFQLKKSFFQWLGRWEVLIWGEGMTLTILILLVCGGEGKPAPREGLLEWGMLLFYCGGTFLTAWCATQCIPRQEKENRWTRHGNCLIFLWLLLGFLGITLEMRVGISQAYGLGYGLGVLGTGCAIFSLPMKETLEKVDGEVGEEEEEEEASSPMPERVTQQWIREISPTGEERISGQVAVTLAPWQKKSVVYLSFCPPFTYSPELECYPLEENGEVEPGIEIFPHGAKIPVRRRQVSGLEEWLTFHFCASEKGEKNA